MEKERLLKNNEEVEENVKKSNIKNLFIGNLAFFILTLASRMHTPVMSQYLYKRVSEDVFGNNSVVQNSEVNQTCYLNTSDPNYLLQEKAQEVAAAKQMQYTIMKSALGIVSNILLGSYSDSIGRKFAFAVPLTGHFLRYAITAVIIFWDLDLNFFFISEGFDGLMGGYYGILLASYTYTADNTPATGSRTMGLAIVEFCESIGSAASSTATGYFIEDTGFFYPCLVASLLVFLDIIFVLIALPEKEQFQRKTYVCLTPCECLRRVFGFYVLHGSARKRVCFSVALIMFIFTCLPGTGSSNISTLFQLNLPFCWSPEMIGYYSTASSMVMQLIGLPMLRIMQCCCLDEVIGVIGSIAYTAGDAFQGFAYNNLMMYAALVIKIPVASVYPVSRAILSIMAPANRQGSLFASIAVIETACSLVGTPIFSNIYQETVVWWRGFVFVIMAASHAVATILLVIYIIVSKPEREARKAATLVVEREEEKKPSCSEDIAEYQSIESVGRVSIQQGNP